MRLISLLSFSAIALASTSPAAARERTAPSADQVARALADPQVQAGVATVIGAFTDAILDTRVGPLAHYAPKHDGIRADDTLRDLARRGDPDFDRRLQDDTRGAVALAGQTASDAAAVRRELGVTAERLRKLFDATAGAMRAAQGGDGADGD